MTCLHQGACVLDYPKGRTLVWPRDKINAALDFGCSERIGPYSTPAAM